MTSLPSTSIYTPLESLLLFQALRIGAVESNTFTRISDELKAVPLVKDDPSYDAARLTPDALRQLYLDLLKDEAKRDLERQLNGDVLPTSRKRKAPSPKLPSVQEAVQHSHLIPQLITRLYTRYREITVNQIREQEKRYDGAVRELDEIKAGKLDEKLNASRQTSPKMSVASLIQTENQPPKSTTKRPSQTRIDAVINHGPNDQTLHRRTPSGTVLPPLSEMTPHSPHYTVPPKMNSGHAYQPSQSAYPAHGHHVGSPQLHNPINRASASPRPILPPPAALAASPSLGSPGVSTPTMQSPQAYHAQARVPAPQQQQQQNNQAYGRPYQLAQPPHLPTPQGYYPPQQYPDRRPSYPHQPQQVPVRPGYVQYQNSPYQQVAPQMQQYPVQYQPQYMPNAPATGPRPQPTQRVIMSDVLRALTTPPRPLRQPVWKSEKRPLPGEAPGSPTRPIVEPLSPVLARASSPTRRAQSTRTRKSKRESSIAVSDHDDSARHTRSVSVVSTAKSTDDNASKRRVKNEATPFVADSEEPEQVVPSMTTRKRRGTLTQPPAKRQKHSVDDTDDEPPPRPTTVPATRNFARMSTVIMQEIISHKHGSRFAQPVRDKDADGYSTFVKMPQDLKSIRAAITNGSRAITAATTAEAPSTPGGTKAQDSVVELDRSIDLIPPKAIVNGAQLEREIMRMFANAVMFNPGEDGMVSDTREMFEDVEARIAEWRGAERDLGAVAPAEEEDEGRAKRRKL
ncbi:hypothetical protein AMS68_002850 [Peltaster fructicola]|uniref:Uncharacterized protein n=1 Tax=Peltaster fructicola TaxID=286661 RepID=A0A6H0XRK2_9PEZI|nr:hypothetical protein AMS68_002850 [Peltaster fructicola]